MDKELDLKPGLNREQLRVGDRITYHRASAASWGLQALTSADLPDEIRQ